MELATPPLPLPVLPVLLPDWVPDWISGPYFILRMCALRCARNTLKTKKNDAMGSSSATSVAHTRCP